MYCCCCFLMLNAYYTHIFSYRILCIKPERDGRRHCPIISNYFAVNSRIFITIPCQFNTRIRQFTFYLFNYTGFEYFYVIFHLKLDFLMQTINANQLHRRSWELRMRYPVRFQCKFTRWKWNCRCSIFLGLSCRLFQCYHRWFEKSVRTPYSSVN